MVLGVITLWNLGSAVLSSAAEEESKDGAVIESEVLILPPKCMCVCRCGNMGPVVGVLYFVRCMG